MKCELRAYKSLASLSEETIAMTASLYIDGRKAADVKNEGHGGPHHVHFKDRDLEQRFYDYCKSLPPVESEYGPLTMDYDLYLSQLVEQAESDKWLRKQKARKILFRLKGDDEGAYRTISTARKPAGWRAQAVEHVKAKYGEQIVELHW